MDAKELTEFLSEASLPHAFETSNATSMPDGSTTITFEQGDWAFHDNFFGGEPYGGRTVIHYRQKPVWMMVYYGEIHDTALGADDVYGFLRLALRHSPEDKPLRGPESFAEGNLEYRNEPSGTIESYSGRETILENSKEIYRATYVGGLIDQQEGVGF